jgi:xylulose-5-phosphate/fructose-6-phosphate phosphoketolase
MTTTSVITPAVARSPLAPGELEAISAWWRAANYLALGQTYLMGNPQLESPLRAEQISTRSSRPASR